MVEVINYLELKTVTVQKYFTYQLMSKTNLKYQKV